MAFDNPLPAALSPSRLSDFQSCPRRYQHAAIDRIPQPATYATVKGILVHHVFEHLFALAPAARTPDAARAGIDAAEAATFTDKVVADIGLDDEMRARLRREVLEIIDTYFTMEDPRAVSIEGVELRVTEQLDGAPVLGILDRLDRAPDGALEIVDYKTGSVPRRDFDSQTFANTELYAALCEASTGERPARIRLMYVSHGASLERPVTEPVLRARARAAADAWRRITAYYEAGEFPATPSARACRFCSFRDRCTSAGVAVPT